MIFASVGTFVRGFDELVRGVDFACGLLRIEGLAQIGHSAYVPSHLHWMRFFDAGAMHEALERADLVICHGGIGILGDAMRAGRRIVAVPRIGRIGADNPANDQFAVTQRLAKVHGFDMCEDFADLPDLVAAALRQPRQVRYDLSCDVNMVIANFLRGDEPATRNC